MVQAWRTPDTDQLSTTERGYGQHHQKARATAARHHQPTDPCARCGHPLGPMGPHLHYDHNDDRTDYLGFSHGKEPCPVCGVRCNELAAAHAGNPTSRRELLW